jgi:hypothetical protein
VKLIRVREEDNTEESEVTIRSGDHLTVMIGDTGLCYEIEEVITIDPDGSRTCHFATALKPSLYERSREKVHA